MKMLDALAALVLHPIRTLNDWLSWPDLDGEDTQEQ